MALPATIKTTGGLCMPCKNLEEKVASEKPFKLVAPQLHLDLKTASETPFFNLCDTVWDMVVKASYASNFKDDTFNYPESKFALLLPEHWQIAYSIHAMEYDVLAGGFDQFFDNHADVLNPVLEHGLGLIGASVQQRIFLEATQRFESGDSFEGLDNDFYDACRVHSDPRELLAAYIVTNHSKFTE
jgi:hypothetical protein